MHHIDITLSVSGSNLLQTFKEVNGQDQGLNMEFDLNVFLVWIKHGEML